jgi:hypothetical protein
MEELCIVKISGKLNQHKKGTVANRPIGKSIHLLKISEVYHGWTNDNN